MSLLDEAKKTFKQAVASITKLMGKTKAGDAPVMASLNDRIDAIYGGGYGGWVTATGIPGVDQILRLEREALYRFQDYENMDDFPETCLTGDTLVRTVQGSRTIKDLAENGCGDAHVLAYDLDRGRIVVARCLNARKTGEMLRVLGVELDTGMVVRCTPEHRWLLRDGSYVEASALRPGASLMPCMTRVYNGYMEIAQVGKPSVQKRWERLCRVVLQSLLSEEIARVGDGPRAWHAHHINGNKLDDRPENLVVLTPEEHAAHHGSHGPRRIYPWTDEHRARHAERLLGNQYAKGNVLSAETRARMSTAHALSPMSEETRRKVGDAARARKIKLPEDHFRRVCQESRTVREAADRLGVGWSTVRRGMIQYGIELHEPEKKTKVSLQDLDEVLRKARSVADVSKELGVDWTTAKRALEFHGRSLSNPSQFAVERDPGNHKVLRVFDAGNDDVYDLEVPGLENFALAAGVFVHNSAALDIIAEDATQSDPRRDGHVVHLEGENQAHVDVAQECLDTLEMDDMAEPIVRSYCKYGSDYEEILLGEDGEGVVGLNYLPAALTTPIEDEHGVLLGYLYCLEAHQKSMRELRQKWNDVMALADRIGPNGERAYEWWRIAHFCLQSKNRGSLIGTSVFDSARQPWKRLVLTEDASVLHKLTRAPARDVISVECGDLPDKAAMAHLNRVKGQHKKRSYVDQATGQIASTYSPLSIPDDYYVPMKAGVRQVEIDQLEPRDWQSIDLLEYFQGKVFAALTVPKAWMSFTEDMQSRATLSQQDVRFARKEMRIQKVLRNGIRHILAVHFAARGIDPDSVDVKVLLTVSSSIFELVQMEVERTRTDVAQGMQPYVSQQWIQRKLFGMTDEEIKKDWKRRKEEAKLQGGIEKELQPADEGGFGGGGDRFGGDSGASRFASPGDQGQATGVDAGAANAGDVIDAAVQNKAGVADTGKKRASKKKAVAEKLERDRERDLAAILEGNADLRRRVTEIKKLLAEMRSIGG